MCFVYEFMIIIINFGKCSVEKTKCLCLILHHFTDLKKIFSIIKNVSNTILGVAKNLKQANKLPENNNDLHSERFLGRMST
jgi:hypothetical protein